LKQVEFIEGDSIWIACVVDPPATKIDKLRWYTYSSHSLPIYLDSSGIRVVGPQLPRWVFIGVIPIPFAKSATVYAEGTAGGSVVSSNGITLHQVEYVPVDITPFKTTSPVEGLITVDPRDTSIVFEWEQARYLKFAGYQYTPRYGFAPVDSFQVFIGTNRVITQPPVASTTETQIAMARYCKLERATTYYWYVKAFVTTPDVLSGALVQVTDSSAVSIFTTTSPPN
jgi:hypothetical protein